jgi:asparagine synthase (glutamine-hydrolysing)
MCGIAGLVLKKRTDIDLPEAITDMVLQVKHRGPDGEGFMIDAPVAFGHRRLAIVDLSPLGHQPMFYHNGQLVITYNGEIYNHIELRQALEQKGHLFRSHTDTEVILAAYLEWGEDCVTRFNGMWAFAILDKSKNILFCSRDRFGVKPFYYVDTPSCFAFGSEIKQLLPFLQQKNANQDIVLDFILTGITDHTQATFFKGITKLQPGHHLIYSLAEHQLQIKRYYHIQIYPQVTQYNAQEAVEHFMHLLEDAVRLRLRADVAVGTCLSGGLDSSTVASIAAPLYQSVAGRAFNGITAVSEQASNNEAHYAHQVIEHAGMQWLTVQPSYADFVDSLPHLVTTQEEPFGGPSLTMQYFVMKKAREQGIPVLLDGQGGDETLLGYDKYYGSYLADIFHQQGLGAFIKTLRVSGKHNQKLTFMNAMKYLIASSSAAVRYQFYLRRHRYLSNRLPMPQHLSDYSKSILNAYQLQQLEIEQTNLPVLLRYEDKNSMAHSIETRLPFLDYRVVEAALSISSVYKIKDGWSKWILRKGMEHRMPDTITWRKNKFGFEAPESLWLSQHANDMQTTVQSSSLLQALANPKALQRQFVSLDYRSQWRLFSIALWERAFGVSI